ncbi:hypothetical protein Tco_0775059 [Tanacetum coccineum]
MAKQAELNNRMRKKSSQKDKPVWNNVQRMNHKNRLVPKAVLTRTGKILINTARTSSTNTVNTTRTSSTNTVNTTRTSGTNTVNTARHNFNRQAVPINAARKVNTIKPIMNNTRSKAGFHKSVSPFGKSFNRTTTLGTNFSKQKVNTAEVNAVSVVKGKRETAVKSSAGLRSTPIDPYAFCKDEKLECGMFQVTPKTSHLNAVKRIFRRLSISWQETYFLAMQKADNCATSTTEAEYVAAANCFNWTSAKSQTINNVRYINAKVAGKPVTISEASIRSNLHFDDVDGIDSLNNQAYIVYKASKLKNVHVPLDNFPIHALSTKVFSFIVKKGKHFSAKVTPLFPNMLVQPTEDEGEGSEIPSTPQPIPSPPHPSSGESGKSSSSEKSLSWSDWADSLNVQVKKLKKQARPFIPHHKAWLRAVKRNNQNKKKVLKTSKRRKRIQTREENYEGKTDKVDEKGESTAQQQSTDRQDEEPRKYFFSSKTTPSTSTPTTFGDDETFAKFLLNMSQAKAVSKEKEKGVEIRNAENAERPRTTSTRSVLTLKPLPKIDPNDKRKKRIKEDEESDTESEEIAEAKKKFDQIAHDKEVARKMQEDWETKEERKRLTEEE